MINDLKKMINEHLGDIRSLMDDNRLLDQISRTTNLMVTALQNDHKILFCGNGGSAADAEHLAGELSGKFKMDRPPLFAEALHVNGAALTAVANDYDFNQAFARLLLAKGKEGDILYAMSTSGTSGNILNAMKQARDINMQVVGLSGITENDFQNLCDIHIQINARNTPRIQEIMMLIGHMICEQIENKLFG